MWLFLIMYSMLVWAVEPTSPELRVPVGESAVATTLPRVNPYMVEIRMSYTRSNLATVLDGLRSRHITSIHPVNTGGGDWLVRVVLNKPDLHVDAVVVNGGLDIWVRQDEEVMYSRPPLDSAPSIQELLYSEESRAFVIPPDMDLKFLYGESLAYKTSLTDFHSDFGQPTSLPSEISEDDFYYYRNQYLDVKSCIDQCTEGGPDAPDEEVCFVCEEQMGQARYELGWVYLSMGRAHEARFYLEPLSATPGKLSPLNIALSQAQAALQVKDTKRVRELLKRAYLYGANEATIIEGLSFVSLETGSPSRGVTGRLLANLTARPESVLLAAELLQMEGYFEESYDLLLPLYQAQEFADNPKLLSRLALRLGDACMVKEQLDAARGFYIFAPVELREVRNIHLNMLEAAKSASDRVKLLPTLRGIAMSQRGEARAEALYLSGQIDTALGTRLDAIQVWADFMRHYPKKSSETDVGARLWALYAERVYILYQNEMWMKIVETHERAWTPMMYPFVMDPEIMLFVAEAYNEIGLSEKALSALYVGFRVASENELNAPDLIFYLVELYLQTGRNVDGLSALQEIELLADSSSQLKGEYYLLKGQLNEALVQDYIQDMVPESDPRYLPRFTRMQKYLEDAKESYLLASEDTLRKNEAFLRLGTLAAESGDCQAALSYFDDSIRLEEIDESDDYLPHLLYAQCLEAKGREEDATETLRAVQGRLSSEDDELRVLYSLSRLLSPNDVELKEEDTDSIWGQLIEDDREQLLFESEYTRWLKATK
jgi:hypothetical protein